MESGVENGGGGVTSQEDTEDEDQCSASHEFEWRGPDGLVSCEVSPARHSHDCRRTLTPVRSSWCCPSPPPACFHHHYCSPHRLYCSCCRSRKRDCSPVHWQIPVQTEEINSFQKVHDLENEKKNLILQTAVLADQVEVQAEKIVELERILEKKREEFKRLEQTLHQEVLVRSSIESSKLELMTELSNLRLRLTAAERDRKESDDKSRKLECELASYQNSIQCRENEHLFLKGRVPQNGTEVISAHEKNEKLKPTLDSSATSSNSEIFQSTQPHSLNRASNALTFQKSNSAENIGPTVKIIKGDFHYDTMPRQTGSQVLQQLQVQLKEHAADSKTATTLLKSDLVDKDSYTNSKDSRGGSSGKRSGVSFAEQECIKFSSSEKVSMDHVAPLTPPPYLIKAEKDKRGFLKFFSKFKKSGSQNLDRFDSDFKRGGIRATAGPRLGWTQDVPKNPDVPFCHWNVDNIVEWIQKLGLAMYASECKRWMCNGDMLITASSNDLEKELGLKNPLHKKKLMLAIKSMNSDLPLLPTAINNLDYHWVVRWLDDIGLPQYKDSFAESRVDGRVLHYITVEDLLYLKVNSLLHHCSIRRGIQVLREKGFNPHCFIRRSLPEESKIYTPELVALWSNHRVMEWLRTVDLSEYAPNLRGSGVHGALIVYEAKFNSNLFATLLNIPPTKTLLRRHLATHFKHIVGDELTSMKREKEAETPLSPSVKVKSIRKNQFTLKKRNKSESENEEYVCPMEIKIATITSKAPEGDKLIVRRNSDPSPQTQEQKLLDFKNNIDNMGGVSKEITQFPTILQDENLNEAPTTIV
ncbi:hypothetical protein JTE90_010396 [Oedothorax gibbosus]|uniref:SAM domain-containing protein n=1 Tax=Oedothorax gibbosus TaxID=931172 RepID=A0AAV6W3D6_9ARAC|nr:hypothetical protein JTE90_010396 [Oedothorax gibbosus]